MVLGQRIGESSSNKYLYQINVTKYKHVLPEFSLFKQNLWLSNWREPARSRMKLLSLGHRNCLKSRCIFQWEAEEIYLQLVLIKSYF